MTRYKSRPCTQCSERNMGKSEVCWKCERINVANSIGKKCHICDAKITEISRKHLSYCSNGCGTILSEARAIIGSVVSRMISSNEIPKASALKCVDCGKDAFDYDHRYYQEPANVVPVCRSCNIKRGPANDVREFVAKHLGIDVSDVPKFMDEKRKSRKIRRASYLPHKAA